MSLLTDFKKFALRGNVIDLAVGFTVGAAFTTVVKSLVNDIIMPPIGWILGNADFSDLFLVLDVPDGTSVPAEGFANLAAAQSAGAVTLNYGLFLNNLIALSIVAMSMFWIIRLVNRMDEELDEVFGDEKTNEEPTEKKCEYCRTTIAFRATRCPHCTSEVSIPDMPSKSPQPSAS